jgi:hypothetical protein
VSKDLSEQLLRFTEQRGESLRLDDVGGESSGLLPVFTEISDLTAAIEWKMSRAKKFERAEHINALELEEVLRELKWRVALSLAPARVLNAVDNNVTFGCWGKGRSPSMVLNVKLRGSIGWQVLGRKALHLY